MAAVLLASSTIGSTLLHLGVLAPTGAHAVGKAAVVLTDASREELGTEASGDHRRVRIVAWYPAVAGTGEPAAYLEDLDRIAEGLEASGSIGAFEAAGLRLIDDPARRNAEVVAATSDLPVVLLSPGNATNVEFYASLAEELASQGYVVIGIDHPFQSAAVDLGDLVAVYSGDPPLGEAERVTVERIGERVDDIGFVLERLAADAAGLAVLRGSLDLERVALIGHSNGGIAAVEACGDARVRACVNIDGQNRAGPFGIGAEPVAPANPFLFITKDAELHPALVEVFEGSGEAGSGAYRAIVASAEHDSFSDGPRFRPRVLPGSGTADDVLTVTRGTTLAFLDHVLRGEPQSVLGEIDAPADLLLEVYPLRP